MRLLGKVAIITGAGSGMGKASALLFAREGARVLAVDISGEAAAGTAAAITAGGGEAAALQADVSVAADADAMVQAAVALGGALDILFNNAGIPMPFTPVEEVAEELWDRLFAINVKGIFLAVRAAIPVLRRQGRGVILNTASTAGFRPRPGLTPYNATKGAVITLTKSLAIELAPAGIRVNCISPVATDTPMLAEFIGNRDPAAAREAFRATVPLGRLATPEDIARAALYLASDEAALVTGISLDVDGGRGI